jgi:hypothetical protein
MLMTSQSKRYQPSWRHVIGLIRFRERMLLGKVRILQP